jgi:arginine deiminase
MWINRDTVVIGTGNRTSESGANQVEAELRNQGVSTIIRTETPYGTIHLDGYMNMVDTNKMIIFPWHVSHDCAKQLREKGVKLVEASNIEEVIQGMALNLVALAPGKVVMPAGNPETKAVLINEGIEVIEVEMSEIINGGGAMHCMTSFLRRDTIGK